MSEGDNAQSSSAAREGDRVTRRLGRGGGRSRGRRGWWIVSVILFVVVVFAGVVVTACSEEGSAVGAPYRSFLIWRAKREGMDDAILCSLRDLDPLALTPEGVIRSYELNPERTRYNRYTQIEIYVNGDKSLIVAGGLMWNTVNIDGKRKQILGFNGSPNPALRALIAREYWEKGSDGAYHYNERYKRLEAEWKERGAPEVFRRMPEGPAGTWDG